MGCISGGEEVEYRGTVAMTKEMVGDFRRNRHSFNTVSILREEVKVVEGNKVVEIRMLNKLLEQHISSPYPCLTNKLWTTAALVRDFSSAMIRKRTGSNSYQQPSPLQYLY